MIHVSANSPESNRFFRADPTKRAVTPLCVGDCGELKKSTGSTGRYRTGTGSTTSGQLNIRNSLGGGSIHVKTAN